MSRLTDEDSPLRVVRVNAAAFHALPDEYSGSVPTGVVVGKKWKRHQPYQRSASCSNAHDCGHWLLGEYVRGPSYGSIFIQWSVLKVEEEAKPFATWRSSSEPVFQQLSPRTPIARALRAAAERHVWNPEED